MAPSAVKTIDTNTLKNNDALLLYNELVLIHNEMIILFQDLMQSYKNIINNNNYTAFKQCDVKQIILEHDLDLIDESVDHVLILDYMRKINNKNVQLYVKINNDFKAICANKFMCMYNIFEFVNRKYTNILIETYKLKQKIKRQEDQIEKIMNIYDELNVKNDYIEYSHAFNHLKMKIVVHEAHINALSDAKIYTF